MRGLLAQRRPTGAIDVDAAVAILASAQPLLRMPRRLQWSVRHPVEVFVDLSESMQPFRRDQVQLLDMLYRALGTYRVKVATFRDFPRAEYRTPSGQLAKFGAASGASVLVLGAPGDGESLVPPATLEMWRRFLVAVTEAGKTATVLSPTVSAATEWAFDQLAPMVTWDRTTGAQAVRGIRRAHGAHGGHRRR